MFIEQVFSVVYESRSGLIALLHRLGLVYRRPTPIGRGLGCAQAASVHRCLRETVEFAWPRRGDAVRGRRASHLCGAFFWLLSAARRDAGRPQTSGRERLNIDGALI